VGGWWGGVWVCVWMRVSSLSLKHGLNLISPSIRKCRVLDLLLTACLMTLIVQHMQMFQCSTLKIIDPVPLWQAGQLSGVLDSLPRDSHCQACVCVCVPTYDLELINPLMRPAGQLSGVWTLRHVCVCVCACQLMTTDYQPAHASQLSGVWTLTVRHVCVCVCVCARQLMAINYQPARATCRPAVRRPGGSAGEFGCCNWGG